ncbi:hypothetical protein Lalb_Chr21g0310311 [Lupinus albus]|uniref:Uncharacterized protein n=1 Tax=Lupinus albus TaxID=3870 RepID=A0A6A4NKZ4_LUPAL|nr:hypothetical protein Lalb_Chr21g0310311 [Lupinus albus]
MSEVKSTMKMDLWQYTTPCAMQSLNLFLRVSSLISVHYSIHNTMLIHSGTTSIKLGFLLFGFYLYVP